MQQISMQIPLKDHQVYCKDFAKKTPYCGLFLKMGLGKTASTLELLYELNPHDHVLIVAPKTVARCTWIGEIKKWNVPFRCQSLIVNNKGKQLSKKKRDELWSTVPSAPPTVYFINRELITTLVKTFPGKKWPFKTVVLDESQSFKSGTSQRFKSMQTVRPFINRVILLTGSPQPRGIEDLWSQIWLLDMGQRLGKYITHFRNEFMYPTLTVNGYPAGWKPKPGAKEEIYRRIKDIVISMENDFIELPDLIYNDVEIELDEDSKTAYKRLAKEYVLHLDENTTIDAVNAAVLQNKLSQMASGAIYTDAKTREYKIVHTAKLEMTEHIVNDTDDNIIIAYHFQSDMKMILDYFAQTETPAVVFDGSPEMQDAWNRGEYKIMLLQPASSGEGANLQDGGATLIWYTLPWSLKEYEQTNARIYRQGQTRVCTIHHLIAKNTVDIRILASIKEKDMSQQSLIDAVAVTINDIRNNK